MKCSVIRDQETWSRCLSCFPAECRDIYVTWDYHVLFQLLGDGDPLAFFGETSSGTLLFYPVLHKPLPADLTGEPGFSDLASAYGYGGPILYEPPNAPTGTHSCVETPVTASANPNSCVGTPVTTSANPHSAAETPVKQRVNQQSRTENQVTPGAAPPPSTDTPGLAKPHSCGREVSHLNPSGDTPAPTPPSPALAETLRQFETFILEWCRNNRIISEFVRFHPLLGNHRLFATALLLEENRPTVIVPTALGYERVRAEEFARKTRNLIKKAERSGLVFHRSADWPGFQERYLERMRTVGAGSYYAFSPDHFRALAGLGPERALLFDVMHAGKAVSSGVFLREGPWMHYHLSAGTLEAKGLAANDFLLSETIRWACEHAVQRLHLGGGATTRPDDPLFHFKKGFSRQRGTFFTGKRRHDPHRHAALLDRHETTTGRPTTRFQEYQEHP